MAAGIHDLVNEALALPEASRAFLAEKLLESLDYDEDFTVSDEWREEIRRRCKELDDGKSRLRQLRRYSPSCGSNSDDASSFRAGGAAGIHRCS